LTGQVFYLKEHKKKLSYEPLAMLSGSCYQHDMSAICVWKKWPPNMKVKCEYTE